MSLICSICQDLVTERPQSLPETEELSILGMQCGHIFHRCCISEWLNRRSEDGDGNNCPCCKKVISIERGLRLYPSVSDDEVGSTLSEPLTQGNASMEGSVNTRDEMRKLQIAMEDMRRQLEEEKSENEALQLQLAQSLSEMDELKQIADEQKRLRECIEKSGQEALEKLKKEKVDAIEEIFKNLI